MISLVNDNQISFQFQTSGIGAMAEATGNTAVYEGDDGYILSFDLAGDMLAVSVSGEGGKRSPVSGIYYRVVDGGENADDETYEAYDADDADDSGDADEEDVTYYDDQSEEYDDDDEDAVN